MSKFKLCLFCVFSFSQIPDSINGEKKITIGAGLFQKNKLRPKTDVFVSDARFDYKKNERIDPGQFVIEPDLKKIKTKPEKRTGLFDGVVGFLYTLYKYFFFFFEKCINIILKIQRVLDKIVAYVFFSNYSGEKKEETKRLLGVFCGLSIIIILFLYSGYYFSLDTYLYSKILMGS